MKIFLLATVIAGFAVASSYAKAAGIMNAGPVSWYNCAGKPEGDYDHPSDCHKYIACTNASLAYEMDCPVCHVNPVNCPDGRLVFDEAKDSCEWAHDTVCHSSGWASSTEGPSEGPTEGATEGETGGTTETPVVGDPCDPHNCTTKGDCKTYYTCNNETSLWEEQTCGTGMAWNPDGPGSQHGGNCQLFGTLPAYLKEKYWKAEDCLACRWKSLGACSSEYEYLPPHRYDAVFDKIDCGADLVFDLDKLTCVHCSVALNAAGGPCCSKAIPEAP